MRAQIILAAALTVLAFAAGALADEAQDILVKTDATLTKVKDQTYQAELKVLKDGKVVKSMNFTAKLKGLHMKLVRFTAPGDVKDMTVLTTVDDAMYVYIPSFQRVRRVAAHVRNAGFMGTDFSPEELGSAALSVGWNAKMVSQDNDKWVLDLTPKPGTETTCSKMRVEVLKKVTSVASITYFDGQGKAVKTQIREGWKNFGAVTIPARIVVTDLRTGSRSEIVFTGATVNTGLSDDAFTKRAILRAD
ncbi:MAG: outer membrane lipoprotein-sorting protein [Deltaproteobacteria bacterium]|nr:outer membrane lipoprotein-sorting protein [Deltaproteobacteria bacterium]